MYTGRTGKCTQGELEKWKVYTGRTGKFSKCTFFQEQSFVLSEIYDYLATSITTSADHINSYLCSKNKSTNYFVH